MKFNVEVQPAGVKFDSENNILDDALSQFIPLEHSCKTGDCGACCADIVSGLIENENGVLVTAGKILTCQSKAKSDIILKANYYPELVHIKQQTIPCKVSSFEYVTEDIVIIKLRFPPATKFDYLPGQYIDLNFKGIKRSYSIANAKKSLNEIELHIRRVPKGQMSDLLFTSLVEQQLMRIEGPKGTFFIKQNNKPLILIATGTGIAPIKAIVEELLFKKDKRNIYIYWGMQFAKELYCKELIELVKCYPHIKFTPVLSQDFEIEKDYKKGYVQNAVINDFDSLENMEVYACGSIHMINDAKKIFIQHHLSPDAFYFDAFTPAK